MSEDKKIPEGNPTGEGEGPKDDPKPEIDSSPPPSNLPTGQAGEQVPMEVKADTSQPQPSIQHSSPNIHHNQNMEVHHHGHVHEKKKWKEYLFQFLMLFLAVFCGFLAEYQLEHTIENNREKQFMVSLVRDLIADTTKLNSIINSRTARATSLDSLKFLLNSDSPNIHSNDIYYFASTATRTLATRFVPNDGTMLQLKNSGAFRLIRNRAVADSIANYDVSVRNALRQSEVEEILIHDYRQAAAKMFNANIFDQITDENLNVSRPQGDPALANFTSGDLHYWNYKIFSMKTLNKANRRDAKLLLIQAKNLLATLKKEYGIK